MENVAASAAYIYDQLLDAAQPILSHGTQEEVRMGGWIAVTMA